jgi:hypothetical protein
MRRIGSSPPPDAGGTAAGVRLPVSSKWANSSFNHSKLPDTSFANACKQWFRRDRWTAILIAYHLFALLFVIYIVRLPSPSSANANKTPGVLRLDELHHIAIAFESQAENDDFVDPLPDPNAPRAASQSIEMKKLKIMLYTSSNCQTGDGIRTFEVTSGYSEWFCDECFDLCGKKFFPIKDDVDVHQAVKSIKILEASSPMERVDLIGNCIGTFSYPNVAVLDSITQADGCVQAADIAHIRFTDRLAWLKASKQVATTPAVPSRASKEFVVVYNVESSEYFGYQVQTHFYSFQKTNSNSGGKYLRLLTCSEEDDIAKDIPTVRVDRHRESRNYSPINKPDSIDRWINSEGTDIPEVVLVVDPDNWFTKDVSVWVDNVREGQPIAQTAWFYGSREVDEIWKLVCENNCERDRTDHVAVPVFIHRNDLKKIAPLWTYYTLKVIDKMKTDPDFASRYQHTQVTGWSVEMIGYVYAAAHVGVYHDVQRFLQLRDVDPRVSKEHAARVPMIHMGRAWFPHSYEPGRQWWHTEGKDFSEFGAQVWCKCNWTAGDILPWPLPPNAEDTLDFVSYHTLTLLHEAREKFGKLPDSKFRRRGENLVHWSYD